MLRIIISLLVVIHGLIHLMGFVKAFEIAEVSQLTREISRPLGIVWLLTSLLFAIVAILLFINKEWWWIPALPAFLVSQILIITTWQDAKFGTILNLIIIIAIVFGFASWNFNRQVRAEIENIISQENFREKTVVTESMISSLPEPVQNWLNNIGVVGREKTQIAYLKQTGQIKLKPDQKTQK